MKLDSKYFDSIRIKPETDVAPDVGQLCERPGCSQPGSFRAPKGRMREGQYFHFCIDHVRDYNKSYNYFAGMPDEAISAYRVDATTGHRPTWSMGPQAPNAARATDSAQSEAMRDSFGLFHGFNAKEQRAAPKPARPLLNAERKSFAALDLEGGEARTEIKARFKALVKRLHPDANGGDRSSEDRLREIIQAYNHLKAAGYC